MEEQPSADVDEPGLEASWARLERLLEARGLGSPSLEDLIGTKPALEPAAESAAEGATAEPLSEVDRAAERGSAEAAPVESVPTAASEPALVPITDLCYSGRDALVRAAGLRREITGQLTAGAPSESVRGLIEEVLDLVDLGLRT